MTWKQPPPEIRERVNAVLGGDIYAEAGQRYLRVLSTLGLTEIPSTETGRGWYRDPLTHSRLEGAARYSQHLIGLAVDFQVRQAELRRRIVEAFQAQGFTVLQKSRGRVHAQVLTPAEFARALPRLQAAGLYPR